MSTNKDPIFLNSVSSLNKSIAVADTTNPFVMFTADSDGGAVTKLSATTTDTTAVVVVLTMSDGTTSVQVGEVTVPAGAGTDGVTAAKDLLDSLAMPGLLQSDGSLILGPTATLSVNAKATLSTGVLNVAAQGGSYSV